MDHKKTGHASAAGAFLAACLSTACATHHPTPDRPIRLAQASQTGSYLDVGPQPPEQQDEHIDHSWGDFWRDIKTTWRKHPILSTLATGFVAYGLSHLGGHNDGGSSKGGEPLCPPANANVPPMQPCLTQSWPPAGSGN